MRIVYKFLIFSLFVAVTCSAQTLTDADFERKEIITGQDTPWEILWGPDNKIWYTERKGTIKRVDPETSQVETLLTISDVLETGESGLLGLALHPDFWANKPWLYVVYTYRSQGATNGTNTTTNMLEKVVRYTFQNNQLINPVIVLDNIFANTTHCGARLLFMPDKTLLLCTGDAQNQPTSQDRNTLSGKVLRMNEDGTAAANNPISGSRLYSFGHRNPQGMTIANGKIYIADHGANIEDEINVIEPNRNYGWPNVEGPCNTTAEQTFCNQNNVKEPFWSSGNGTEAVAGLDFYPSNLPVPALQNSLIMVSLKTNNTRGRDLRVYKLSNDGNSYSNETILLNNVYGRMRDICISPAGDIYVSTSNQDGRGTPVSGDDKIIRLRYNKVITSIDNENKRIFDMYPNPVTDVLNMGLNDGEKLNFYNSLGTLFKSVVVKNSSVNLEEFPSGFYFIKDESDKTLGKVFKK